LELPIEEEGRGFTSLVTNQFHLRNIFTINRLAQWSIAGLRVNKPMRNYFGPEQIKIFKEILAQKSLRFYGDSSAKPLLDLVPTERDLEIEAVAPVLLTPFLIAVGIKTYGHLLDHTEAEVRLLLARQPLAVVEALFASVAERRGAFRASRSAA
jgi:hypothetical protein